MRDDCRPAKERACASPRRRGQAPVFGTILLARIFLGICPHNFGQGWLHGQAGRGESLSADLARFACDAGGPLGEKALRPLLNPVINPQDFDALFLHPIHNDIGQGWEQKLSGSFLASDTAPMRPLFQGLDGSINFANGRQPVMRMVIFEVIINML
jgi:hypothetical protein